MSCQFYTESGRYGGAKPGYRTMVRPSLNKSFSLLILFTAFLLQLDALSPAVDVLIRDLPGSEGHEQSLKVLKAAVQV